MINKNINKSNLIRIFLFSFVVFLLFSYKAYILFKFTFNYTDQDQAVLWHALGDISKGEFYETRYYGQAYNSLLEAYFALPLKWINIPVYFSLPIITSLISTLPFIFFAFVSFFRRNQNKGLLILILPFVFGFNYDVITSLPRGFVTGIFVSSFMIFFHERKTKLAYFMLTFLAILGYSINPNSILLSIPIIGVNFLENKFHKTFYFYSLVGFLFGGIVHYSLNYFYVLHPNYVLHNPPSEFGLEYLLQGFEKFELFFTDYFAFNILNGYEIFILLFLFAFYFYKFQKNKNLAFISLMIIPLLALPMLNSRLFNAEDTVFYSFSRMYLALPLILAFIIYHIEIVSLKKIMLVSMFFIVLLIFKFEKLTDPLKSIFKNPTYISVKEVSLLKEECIEINKIAIENKAELIVFNDFYYIINNYACSSCQTDFPNTVYPSYERRTWRLIEDSVKIYRNVLFFNNDFKYTKTSNFRVKNIKPGLYLVYENKLKTKRLMSDLGVNCRLY